MKRAMLEVKVADAWTDFNESAYAKAGKIGYPSGTVARFTPVEDGSEEYPVVVVSRRPRPVALTDHDFTIYDGDDSWLCDDEDVVAQEIADSLAEVADFEAGLTVVLWEVRWRFRTGENDGRRGYASSFRDACRDADIWLRNQGWILVETD
tara:strand:- start:3218 stop:3670 length:453 start_codon:yes stop_codon:yes gene_type:complete